MEIASDGKLPRKHKYFRPLVTWDPKDIDEWNHATNLLEWVLLNDKLAGNEAAYRWVASEVGDVILKADEKYGYD